MDSKKPFYKSKLFWVVALFLLYSALGFFTVPYLIKKELKELSEKQLNSTLKVEKISFNPFTISAEIKQLSLTDKDTTTWFKADTIFANINLWKTLFSNTSLAKISLENPYFHIVSAQNTLKYPKLTARAENSESSTLLLDINSIEINQGAIDYDDQAGSKHLSIKLKEIAFSHQGFTTKDIDTQFKLKFITENNSETQLEGQFNFPQLKLVGNWQLKNFQTSDIFNFISDTNGEFLGLQNQTGQVNAQGKLKFLGTQQKLPTLSISTLNLNNFHANTARENEPEITLANLVLQQMAVDLNQQTLSIEQIQLNNTAINISINPQNRLIWHYLTDSQDSITDTSTEQQDNNPWNYKIDKIQLDSTTLQLNKQNKNQTTANKIVFNGLEILNLSSQATQKFQINSNLVTDDEGQIELHSEILATPLTITANIKAQDSNIAKASAWFPKDLLLKLEKGTLSLEQDFTLANKQITSKGWSKISNLVLLDAQNQEFLSIKQLDILDNEIDTAKKTIRLNLIKLDQANGSLSISADKTFNASTLVATPANKADNKKENKKENKTDKKTAKESKDWMIEVKEIEFIDSKTSFNDKSIQPSFRTELSQFNGSIKGLSSSNLAKAQVNLTGALDTYGKISIKGKINPLSEKAYTDIVVDVKNLSLQNLSTYTGKYLGYPITRGKADFKLNYKLNKNFLKGLNDLKFKQLKFGDKTNSKDALNLPLKLAVGLLTDGKGIMNINLPVSGNIDDPKFSYGSLVFKAFFKLITGIVASPFKLLGKLIPGGADLDLSGVQFKAGSLELQDDEQQKLQAIAKIISKRPAIILELTGIVNSSNDKKALQQQKLWQRLDINQAPDFSDENSLNAINKLYIASLGEEKWQKLQQDATNNETINSTLLAENAFKALLEQQDVNEELSLLGKNRALFIQQQLLEQHKLPEDKIFLKSSETSLELPPQVKFGVGT